MKEKLFVLSMDAMVGEDLAYMETKPNFSRLMRSRAQVKQMCTIYPSITYPAHVSIMTGCRLGKHGVYANTEFKTCDDGIDHWILNSSAVKAEDIFAAAKRVGCTTAAVYWPVTGCNPNVDWLLNEYFFPDPSESILDGFARQGANAQALSVAEENLDRFPTEDYDKTFRLHTGATFDHFINGCACSMIRRYQPDVLLVHNCYLDTVRHHCGVFAPEIRQCLDQMDLWLGELIQAMRDAGVYDCTNFVLLSDHGQMDYSRRIALNAYLERGGFVDLAKDGTVADWRAFAQSNGMSAAVYLKDGADEATAQALERYLHQLAERGVVEAVMTREEVLRRYGLDGPFRFFVEAPKDTAFSDDWQEPAIRYHTGATHGYFPEKGPQPVFVARGPAFRAGTVLPAGRVIDEAPTLAKILGTQMPQAEGRCMDELLK